MTLTTALRTLLRPEHTAFTRAMETLAEAEATAGVEELDAVAAR